MPTTLQYHTWTTKDGRELRITDMTDEHLVNTIHMLVRKSQQACDFDNSTCWEHDELNEPEWYEHSKLKHMCAEASRRGLII